MKRLAWMGALILFAKCSQDCSPAEASLVLAGFSQAERNTIILKSYAKGSGFSNMVDSVFINGTNCNCYLRNDSLEISPFISNFPGLRSNFDYEVSLPATGKTFRIEAITENNHKVYTGIFSKVGCMNSLKSYSVNGAPFYYPDKGSVIFLSK